MKKLLLITLFTMLLMASVGYAAEIIVRAVDKHHPDPEEDIRGVGKLGYPIVVMDDGHIWGSSEGLPNYVVIKVPMIAKEKLYKYIEPYTDDTDPNNVIVIRPRLWKIRFDDLPVAARQKLLTDGYLTIKATATYTGEYDYTWTQVKTYFRNQRTGLDETEDIP